MSALARTVWMWCFLLLTGLQSVTAQEARIEYFPVPSEQEKECQLLLDQQVGVRFEDTALTDAVRELMGQGTPEPVRLILDERALNEEGVDAATPVNLQVDGVSRRTALRLLLEPVGLVAMVDGDVVRVTTHSVTQQRLKVRVYPVGDIAQTKDELEQLVETVRQAVDPEAWEEEFPRRTISFVPKSRSLVVRQTAASHDSVLELLRSLRQSLAEDQAQNPPVE